MILEKIDSVKSVKTRKIVKNASLNCKKKKLKTKKIVKNASLNC